MQKTVLNCLFFNYFLWKENNRLCLGQVLGRWTFSGSGFGLWVFFGGYNHLSSFTYPRHFYTVIPEYQLPPPPPSPHTHTHTHTHTHNSAKRKRFRKGRFLFFSNTLFRFKSTHVTGKIKFTHGSIALTSITQRLFHVFYRPNSANTDTKKCLKVLMLCSFNYNKGKIGRKTVN